MVTIIKNQLLKHLSRFTKNLSPEQISLSALRGSGELADLTLDEALLTELLELPTWLRLTSASCNRVSFRIQWTKLKTVPIVLSLDEVRIAVEVCQEPRVPSATGVSAAMPGKYSYIHKVIDGISVNINAVQIHFNCDAFSSSVQLSRVTLESRTPQWARGDLRLTRIKSPDTGQLLIFKELEWQTARVEAQAKGPATEHLPPLRLLAGSAHCRIVIKKLLSDCSVVGCRLVVQPEPLAWALTDGQLRAALACATALAEPARKATAQATRVKAARKMQAEKTTASTASHAPSRGSEHDALARLFARHDVRETSYHLLAPRIDLHLCDDPGLGRSEKPSLSRGGALQVTLLSMQADFFPYHKASDDRRHWRGYREAATPHTQWLNQSLLSFCSEVVEMFAPRPAPPASGTDNHVSYSTADRTGDMEEPRLDGAKSRSGSQCSTHDTDAGAASSRTHNTTTNTSGSSTRTRVLQQLGKLMTTCLILRIDDFTVYKVSTGAKTRESPRPLVCAERATLPGDAGLLHAELTSFYYPGDVCFPVPPPKMFAQLSPVRVSVDVDTCVWLAAFLPHVARALTPAPTPDLATPVLYMDVRMEAIMPKIVLEAGVEHVSQQRDRPRELQICTARASVTNVREPARPEGGLGTRGDLSSIISSLRDWEPSTREFPRESGDMDPIHEKFIMHADGVDDVEFGTEAQVMWKEARDVWCARAEPLWADLCGARATNGRPTPLLDAVPLTLWAYFNEDFSKIWALARAGGLAGLQLNHYQMLFLLRKLEHMSELAAWLAHDARRQPNANEGSILLAALVPQVEVTLVLPTSCGGPESSRDIDQDSASVLVDSSSLQDFKSGLETSVSCGTGFCAQSSLEVFISAPAPVTLPTMEEETHMLPPTPPPTVTFTNNFASFSSMRRGLTSLVSSIDGALARDDSRSDAASTASSDSERYVIVGLAGDTPDDADNAFRDFEHSRVSGGVEVAAEVLERSSSPSEQSVTSSCRRRDLVSTSTWRIDSVYAVYQARGDETSVRVTAAELATEECSSIPWDEFQSKFAMRARNWTDPTVAAEQAAGVERAPPHMMARLQRREMPFQGNSGQTGVLCPSEELLRLCVRDLCVCVGASTALALAEFAEDELVQPPMPVQIMMENVKLHVIEDRPARSISSPPPQSLDVTLSSLCVSRSGEGVVEVGPAPRHCPLPTAHADEGRTELAEAREKMSRLARENEELRKRLTTLAHVVEDNRELRVRVDEANVLRECAHAAQQETAALLADKRALLDTVRVLQEQLSSVCVSRGTGKR